MARADIAAVAEVLERITDGFLAYDADWRYTYVNRAAAELLGLEPETLLGKVIWDVFPQVKGTPMEAALRSAAETQEPRELELVGPVTGLTMNVRIHPSPAGLTVYVRDITERKRAEDALHESEARHRALFVHSLEGIMLTAPDGRILDVNPAACEMLQRDRDAIIALGRAGVVDASDPRLPVLLAARERDGHVRGELTMVRRDGSRLPVEISSAIFIDAHGEKRTSMTFRDLTEQKRAVAALQMLGEVSAAVQSSLELRDVLAALAAGVVPALAEMVVIDVQVDERPTRVVAHAREGLEAAAAVVQARPPLRPTARGVPNVLRTGDPELVPVVTDAWLQQVAQDEAHLEAIRSLALSSLLIVPLRARGVILGALTLMRTTPGQPYGEPDLPLARGIADRAALAIDNARLYAEAVAARKRRDEMFGIVSHDLRSPLNAIALSARLLEMRQPSPQVDAIRAAVARAERLVKDLVAITAIESGKLPLDRRPTALASLLAEVAALYRGLADERHIALDATASDDAGELDVDRHRILQALSNLVGNAIKFTPPGGRIAMAARREDAAVMIEVTDTGAGIPADELDHVFDAFWRGGSGEHGGVGLGLAITKGVIEAHGGSIEARSEVGHGTTFVIRLPAGSGTP